MNKAITKSFFSNLRWNIYTKGSELIKHFYKKNSTKKLLDEIFGFIEFSSRQNIINFEQHYDISCLMRYYKISYIRHQMQS